MKTNKRRDAAKPEVEHTPLPWHFDGPIILDNAGNAIGRTYLSVNGFTRDAAFIVRAVNAYDEQKRVNVELLKALKELLGGIDIRSSSRDAVRQAEQAIAKAEAQS